MGQFVSNHSGLALLLTFSTVLSVSLTTAPSAFAEPSNEQRLRTDAIEIFIPKTFKVPVNGCSYIPVTYSWRSFYSEVTHASVYIAHPTKDQIIGGLSIWTHKNPGSGILPLQICSYKFPDTEDGGFYSRARKGPYDFNLTVFDLESKTRPIQLGPDRKIRLN
jgi:hypothetical protein